jgi:hypothetical protein
MLPVGTRLSKGCFHDTVLPINIEETELIRTKIEAKDIVLHLDEA